MGQSVRLRCGCVYVLRHVNGSANPPGTNRCGNGQRACTCSAACGAGFEFAEYARYTFSNGYAENNCIRHTRYSHGDNFRYNFRNFLLMETKKMKKIQILGTGCPKCKTLAENAEAAAKDAGIEYELEKVAQINDIMKMGVMVTPALAIDGEVKVSGKVVSPEDIKAMLS